MQSAVASSSSVFVDDISHHVVHAPDVNGELLLMVSGAPLQRLALFPLHSSRGIVGGLYITSSADVSLSTAQPCIETFLAVVAPTIIAVMESAAPSSPPLTGFAWSSSASALLDDILTPFIKFLIDSHCLIWHLHDVPRMAAQVLGTRHWIRP